MLDTLSPFIGLGLCLSLYVLFLSHTNQLATLHPLAFGAIGIAMLGVVVILMRTLFH
jgi:hypothetical protein